MTEADWLSVLRERCKETSQTQVAKATGYSTSTISNVLAGKYKGDILAVEQAVRGAFMGGRVECPVLGPTSLSICSSSQRRTKKQAVRSTGMVFKLWQACRQGCPHSRLDPTEVRPTTQRFDPFTEQC